MTPGGRASVTRLRRLVRRAGGVLSVLAGGVLSGLTASARADATLPVFSPDEIRLILQHSPPPPPPPDPTNAVADDPRAAKLGQFLFFDPRLSSNGKVSCATCHDPALGFADGKPQSEGVGGVGVRHTPSVWNAAHNRWQFWDGRADTLWSQALKPLESELEMGFSRLEVVHLLRRDADLRGAYERIFGALGDFDDPSRFPAAARPSPYGRPDARAQAWARMSAEDQDAVNRVFANAGKAIAAYERKLVSRGAPFDRFAAALRVGDSAGLAALSPSAQRGLKLFIGRAKCRLCHSGPNFSDGEFHNTGVPPRGGGMPRDPGRYEGAVKVLADPFNAAGSYSDERLSEAGRMLQFLANRPENWGLFKTPGLRNVARTAPYMHQGQFATLEEVVTFYSTREGAVPMGHHRQETILTPLGLTEQERADLVAFLTSLNEESPPEEALVRRPASPAAD